MDLSLKISQICAVRSRLLIIHSRGKKTRPQARRFFFLLSNPWNSAPLLFTQKKNRLSLAFLMATIPECGNSSPLHNNNFLVLPATPANPYKSFGNDFYCWWWKVQKARRAITVAAVNYWGEHGWCPQHCTAPIESSSRCVTWELDQLQSSVLNFHP